MKTDLQLPARFERRFSLHLYWVSHGLLLLRSGKSNTQKTRIDLLFQDVVWVALPAWFETIEIFSCETASLPLPLAPTLQEEVRLRQCYRLVDQGIDHFIVAERATMSEDHGEYFQQSSLLPDLRVTESYPEITRDPPA